MRLMCTAVLGLSACAPSNWRNATRQEPPDHIAPLDLYCEGFGCSADVRGVVTLRGNDPVDWFAVELPPSDCDQTLRFELTWSPPRDGLRLALEMPDVKRRPRAKRSKNRIVLEGAVRGGRWVVGVRALAPSGAGDYRLQVSNRWSPCGPSRDIYSPRPEGLVLPRGSGFAAVVAAGMSRVARDGLRANEPSLIIEVPAHETPVHVKPGTRLSLVDPRGEPIHHGELTMTDVWSPDGITRFASVRFDKPGWFRRAIELGWSHWFVRFRD